MANAIMAPEVQKLTCRSCHWSGLLRETIEDLTKDSEYPQGVHKCPQCDQKLVYSSLLGFGPLEGVEVEEWTH